MLTMVKLQLELGSNVIKIRSSLWEGVLTHKTFKGHQCYKQMLDFLKQAYPDEKFIPAVIVINK
jgi:hypothetical protein